MVRTLDYFSYRRGIQYFMAGGFALLLAFQGHTTFERNDIVRSDLHLWLDNVQKAPNLSRPRINLARHYYEAGMINEAVEEWKKAEGLDRDTNLRQIGVASYNLGVYYLNQKGQLDKAEQQFDRALKRFPGYPPAIVGLAKIQLKKGQPEEASRLLQEHAPRHPIHVEMLNAYGLVHLKTGNERDALKAALRSIQLKPHDPQPWEISGEAWRRLGQPQKAIESWEEALRLNPANPTALLALVDLYDRTTRRADLARIAAQCLVLKGSTPLDAWLAERAANAGMSAYEVNPGRAGRIIRRELSSELSRSK